MVSYKQGLQINSLRPATSPKHNHHTNSRDHACIGATPTHAYCLRPFTTLGCDGQALSNRTKLDTLKHTIAIYASMEVGGAGRRAQCEQWLCMVLSARARDEEETSPPRSGFNPPDAHHACPVTSPAPTGKRWCARPAKTTPSEHKELSWRTMAHKTGTGKPRSHPVGALRGRACHPMPPGRIREGVVLLDRPGSTEGNASSISAERGGDARRAAAFTWAAMHELADHYLRRGRAKYSAAP